LFYEDSGLFLFALSGVSNNRLEVLSTEYVYYLRLIL
jgi:hypothetical protein